MQSNDQGPEPGAGGALPARSRQALQTIEGEIRAAEFLTRLHSQQADPDELALIVAAMYGAALRGFCRALAKAIWGGR